MKEREVLELLLDLFTDRCELEVVHEIRRRLSETKSTKTVKKVKSREGRMSPSEKSQKINHVRRWGELADEKGSEKAMKCLRLIANSYDVEILSCDNWMQAADLIIAEIQQSSVASVETLEEKAGETIVKDTDKQLATRTLSQLQKEVGEWSLANFGQNETPLLRSYKMSEASRRTGGSGKRVIVDTSDVVCLGSMCSLMGIVEEYGELMEAFSQNKLEDAEDAVGDMMIYLCDYAAREKLSLEEMLNKMREWNGVARVDHETGMAISIGQIYHCTLKRFQGIRNMQMDEVFRLARWRAVAALLRSLDSFCSQWQWYDDGTTIKPLMTIANETWDKVISKRNWKKSPVDGGGHTHLNTPEETGKKFGQELKESHERFQIENQGETGSSAGHAAAYAQQSVRKFLPANVFVFNKEAPSRFFKAHQSDAGVRIFNGSEAGSFLTHSEFRAEGWEFYPFN